MRGIDEDARFFAKMKVGECLTGKPGPDDCPDFAARLEDRVELVDLRKQYRAYKSEIDARMNAVLEHGRFIMGPEIGDLEARLAQYVGVAHAITVANGTASLEIALRALQIGPGDEVITSPFTWISSAEVIALVGAKPVFVDIDADTFNIDPQLIERAITARTKAIIAVDLFGQMADYETINGIASRHNVTVIEDAAQSFGATQAGKRAGSAATVGSTSFFPAKPLGCYGDGGALFTEDETLATGMRAIRTHGGLRRHAHDLVGMNGRLDTIQAAVLLAKLPHFDEELAARSRIAERYGVSLPSFCSRPVITKGNTHVFAQYTVRVANRDELAAALRERYVPTAIYYPKCLHLEAVFASLGYREGDFPAAERASQEVLSLPMHPFLEPEEQHAVINALASAAMEMTH